MIYICIPVHNEGGAIGLLLWKIRKVMAELVRDYEILVHDDASTDDTPNTLRRYRKVMPIEVVRVSRRVGYARATEKLLHTVVARASYPKRDVAITLQGDFTDDPSHMTTLVKTIEGGADIVAGCVPRGRVHQPTATRPQPRPVWWARALAPLALGPLYRRSPVSDPLCGFRAYRVIVLKKVMREGVGPLLSTEGWTANVELLGLLAPHSRRIEEVSLVPRYDHQVRPTRVRVLSVLRQLLRVRRRPWFARALG